MDEGRSTPFLFYAGEVSWTKESFWPLLEALRRLNTNHTKLRLEVFGRGDYGISRLTESCVKMGLNAIVTYRGYVTRELLNIYRSKALLCLALKRHVPFNLYNFPTKLTEYLAARKPVLLSNLPLHLKYFTNKVDALIVDPEDPGEIAEALTWALEHPQDLDRMAEIGEKKLREFFSAEAYVRSLLDRLGAAPAKQNVASLTVREPSKNGHGY